ncbi:benzoate 4-monooxygenase cytochrome P450 [Mytilinidion resinicola]|uniref:Benzoate 4-monooxygenase cytochrome P450 n=1 Tax=Mytilinidion resinicola TaxID=574789 RepID=A0A6A6Z2S0_9PEZI|nr:benzoate 4-monooxygenase cytochrome P450 [Mytilinidion resinicola]KAF2814564.1 benzoate 4-monooxygenase cytochrome P450 [Mytilinidion resinicola]
MSAISGFDLSGAFTIVGVILLGSLSSIFLYFIATAIYNVYFHPLSSFPGPKFWAASSIPFSLSHMRGTFAFDIKNMHDKYGEVFRMGPNQVSFINGDAWKDVYAYRSDRPHFTKDKTNYFTPLNGVESIHSAKDDAVHSRHRRLLAHAFSEKALREQESLLKTYMDLLVIQLKKQSGPVDMVRWLNYTTFDLIGDLTFGEPFGCLHDSEYHPWVAIVFQSMRASAFVVAGRQYPALASMLVKLMPKSLSQKIQDHWDLSVNRLNRRLATKTDRPDFMTYLQRQTGEKGLSPEEMHSNAPLLMIAGSETTGTALSACLYYLTSNPTVFQKLRKEFDEAIKSEEDITITNTSELSYMTNVLNETMRIYNPVPGDLPREAPKEGITVAGYWLPPYTRASLGIYAATHSERNFRDPYEFVPERWDDNNSTYANDQKSAFQPFSTGPRNCIGKNLAWAEMRLILSKLLFNFDIELLPESRNWSDQKMYVLWEKHPLMLNLKPRH